MLCSQQGTEFQLGDGLGEMLGSPCATRRHSACFPSGVTSLSTLKSHHSPSNGTETPPNHALGVFRDLGEGSKG